MKSKPKKNPAKITEDIPASIVNNVYWYGNLLERCLTSSINWIRKFNGRSVWVRETKVIYATMIIASVGALTSFMTTHSITSCQRLSLWFSCVRACIKSESYVCTLKALTSCGLDHFQIDRKNWINNNNSHNLSPPSMWLKIDGEKWERENFLFYTVFFGVRRGRFATLSLDSVAP